MEELKCGAEALEAYRCGSQTSEWGSEERRVTWTESGSQAHVLSPVISAPRGKSQPVAG